MFHLGVKVKYIRDEWHFVCSVVLENKYVSVFTHRRWTVYIRIEHIEIAAHQKWHGFMVHSDFFGFAIAPVA